MNGKDIPHNVQTGLTSLWEYLSHPTLAWSYHQVLDTESARPSCLGNEHAHCIVVFVMLMSSGDAIMFEYIIGEILPQLVIEVSVCVCEGERWYLNALTA